MSEGLQGIWRYVAVTIGLGLTGAAFALAVPFTHAATGSAAPGLLQSERPAIAIAAVLGAFAVSTVVAAIVGRLTNAAIGLFVLGGGVAVLAMRSGTAAELAFNGVGTFRGLAVETTCWAALVLIASLVILAAAGPLADIDSTDDDGRPVRWNSIDAFVGALFAAAVLPAVWLIAQSTMKGQAVAAATIGAMVAGLLARSIKPHARPALLFAAPCLFGALGLMIAAFMTGSTALDVAFVKGSLTALGRVLPADYAAGALVGVSIGLGWARSFIHQPDAAAKPATP